MKKYRVIETIDMTKWDGTKKRDGSPTVLKYSITELKRRKALPSDHPFQVRNDKLGENWHRKYILKNEEINVNEDNGAIFIKREVAPRFEACFKINKELFEILLKQLEEI